MAERQEVLDWIQATVETAGGESGILGSTLAQRFRERFPESDIRSLGFQSLKKAVLSVPHIGVMGSSGLDVIYKHYVGDGPEPGPATPVSGTHTPWFIWATPRQKMALAIAPTGDVAPVSPGSSLPEILPAGESDHKCIAEAFLAYLDADDPNRSELSEILGRGNNWWPDWVSVTNRNRELHNRWITHRLAALKALLRDRLAQTGLPAAVQEVAFEKVIQSRSRRESKKDEKADKSPSDSKLLGMRELVKTAIDLMDQEMLDRLHIPPSVFYLALEKLNRARADR